jgi:RNA polymerase sigma-70 factor (ECF subfamily)
MRLQHRHRLQSTAAAVPGWDPRRTSPRFTPPNRTARVTRQYLHDRRSTRCGARDGDRRRRASCPPNSLRQACALGVGTAGPSLPDRGATEEVLQDTFVAIWRKAGSYSGSGEVAAWIWVIAIRRLIDHLRRARQFAPLPPDRPDVVVSAEDQVLLGAEFGDLAGAIGRLSPELRAVVQATVIDGLSTKEAARLLGIPTGTVKTRMMRARARLREELA